MEQYPVIGNQIARQIHVAKTQAFWSLTHLPDDFYATTQKYPILFFLHGAGEIGNETADGLKKLLVHGPPKLIGAGEKMQFINPNTGKLQKFIVVSPQRSTVSFTTPDHVNYIVANDSLLKDRIDLAAIFVTGISLGAKSTSFYFFDQRDGDLASTVTAVAPFSTYMAASEEGYTFNKAIAAKLPIWLFCGDKDETCTADTRRIYKTIHDVAPDLIDLTIYTGGHCCWTERYDPKFKQNNLNLYEWFLSKIKIMTTELKADAGDDQTIMLPSESVILRGNNSTGPEGLIHVWKQVSGPVQAVMNNPYSIGVTVTGLTVAGEYAFDLILTAPDGKTEISRVTVTVLPDPNAETGITPKVLSSRKGVLVVEGPALTESTVLRLGLVDVEYNVV